ncbi:MAG: UDP-N-acetylglucosamine 1-carboxyvinyltransferase [Planctomycetota bacterium]|jgi:UDP-N-acetylglucosamine 1-carboxyvinyltransferase
MDAFRIQGGHRLSGRIAVDGSKNACLPLMAAALLTDQPVTLRGVPALADIENMAGLLGVLGVAVDGRHGTITLRSTDPTLVHAPYKIVSTMRASICVLGALVARRGRARVAMPGGCSFGARPVDLHLRGLEALGAKFDLCSGDIVAEADRLTGATVFLGGPFGSTVLGTANVMCAATLARGRTVIESAACEPEVYDLAVMLNSMGARISGAGTPRVVIDGVDELGPADHTVMPDRIVACTWAIATAVTNGEVTLNDFPYDNVLAVVDRLNEIGVRVERLDPEADPRRCTVKVTCDRLLKPVMLTTQPYPGFPTDLQAQMMALLCLAQGNSIITEKIYPERFMHVAELTRMGAQIFRQGPTVMVQGMPRLVAAPVMASDLRGSACLVLAGLAAEGTTTVSRVYHLDRGYARMEETLNALGAKIERFDARDLQEQPAPVVTVPSRAPLVGVYQ